VYSFVALTRTEPIGNSQTAFQAFLVSDLPMWAKLVQQSDAKAE